MPAVSVEDTILFVLSECVDALHMVGVPCARNSLGLQVHYKGSGMFMHNTCMLNIFIKQHPHGYYSQVFLYINVSYYYKYIKAVWCKPFPVSFSTLCPHLGVAAPFLLHSPFTSLV